MEGEFQWRMFLKGVNVVDMSVTSIGDLLYVTLFFFGGLGFCLGPFLAVFLLSPKKTRNIDNKTGQFIECGMEPIGSAWIRYGVVYYLYALMFLAFDVDVLFLFPVAMAYNQGQFAGGMRDFIEVFIFVGILSLALVYAWKKGVFKWDRKVYQNQ
ncbi:MAG: NADH-quinone oxidoreductase subunit A [Desulfobulbaceae bacterium]|jgi:NADH:ubiquinone oxidoreductase subunit 3 (subunit A)|nr:NADH-quinone oxidoreductase subunit A [Desulfobulbaceae bacterium]